MTFAKVCPTGCGVVPFLYLSSPEFKQGWLVIDFHGGFHQNGMPLGDKTDEDDSGNVQSQSVES